MTTLLLLGLLAQSPTAPTPSVSLPRADAYVVLGWQNLRQDQSQTDYNDWLNTIVYGGAGAGWFWTDHWKTQIDVGTGTEGHQYRYRQITVGGNPVYETSRASVRQHSVTLSQQYQFFRNQWFHPHVGAGVELARETTTAEFDPTILFDNTTHLTRTLVPAHTEGPNHRFIARGLAETGFKAYMTPRAFFTGDMRLMFRGRIEEVLFRAGFGFDF